MVQHNQTGLNMEHSGLRHNPNMKQLAHWSWTSCSGSFNKTAYFGPPKGRQKERNTLTLANYMASFIVFPFLTKLDHFGFTCNSLNRHNFWMALSNFIINILRFAHFVFFCREKKFVNKGSIFLDSPGIHEVYYGIKYIIHCYTPMKISFKGWQLDALSP